MGLRNRILRGHCITSSFYGACQAAGEGAKMGVQGEKCTGRSRVILHNFVQIVNVNLQCTRYLQHHNKGHVAVFIFPDA